MKRLALFAALAILPACTTLHEDRRTLTDWNLELITDTAETPQSPSGVDDLDGTANPVFKWVFVEPFAVLMLPVSWITDTFVLNPINGFQKAEVQTYNRRFGDDDSRGTAESALKNYQLAPAVPPAPIAGALAIPEFLARWIWNSTYPSDPVNRDSWNTYWNEHHEQSTQ